MNELLHTANRIVVIGDVYVSPDTLEAAVRDSRIPAAAITKLYWGIPDKEEFAVRRLAVERGGPEAVAAADGFAEAARTADVIVTHFNPVTREIIEQAPQLKAILTCRGGLEHIDVAAATEHGIPVVNVVRNAEPVADLTVGMMYAVTRNIALGNYEMKNGRWPTTFYNSEWLMTLGSHLVGIAGMGNIGLLVAKKLKALGVPMIVFDAYTSQERLDSAGLGGVERVGTLEELFERADIVTLHLRLTPETEQSIGAHYFSRMKPTAYFINTARGGLINQAELTACLQQGRPAGAALDVYNAEPVDCADPLIAMPNVVTTPHVAGLTVDAVPRAPYLLMKEVDAWLSNGLTDRVVNWTQLQEGAN